MSDKMKIKNVEVITYPEGNKGVEVKYIDEDGDERKSCFDGDEWLKKENGEYKFIKRLRENWKGIKKSKHELNIDVKKTKLNEFKNKEVKV